MSIAHSAPRWRLAGGTTRVVLLTPRYAIKAPRPTAWRLFLHGLLANMQERMWYRTARHGDPARPDPRLCPVLWSVPGGWLLCMPRAEPCPKQGEPPEDYWDGLPHDPGGDNIGVLARQFVLIDYGN